MRSKLALSLLLLLFCSLPLLGEEPWVASPQEASDPPPSYLAGMEAIIAFHQQVITHADGPRSHFFPSSSSYMLTAIRRFGFVQGFCLGCDRLIRENSDEWVYRTIRTRDGDLLKWDPVPLPQNF